MVLAPFEVVDRGGGAGVVTVEIRSTRKLGASVRRTGIVTVWVPIEAPAGPVEDSIHGHAGSCGRGKERRTSQESGIARAEKQVAVPAENANVVPVLVEGVLHAALADNAQQDQFTWMQVRIAIVRLMGVLRSVVRVHVIRHGATVDQEIDGMVRLGRDIEAASGRPSGACAASRHLLLRIAVNDG